MRTFLVIAVAQFVSLLGSQLTSFGLALWVYQRTESTTLYGLCALATLGPLFLLAPVGGALVDRWSPRVAMLVGHAGAGALTLLATGLWIADALSPAPVIVLITLASAVNAVHAPALSVATSTLVPPRQLARANGVVQLQFALAHVLAPALAAQLLLGLGLGAILGIDVVSFVLALGLLAAMSPARDKLPARTKPSVLSAWSVGFQYVRSYPGLLQLLAVIAILNFNVGMAQVLVAPMVLGFADLATLGVIVSCASLGFGAGSAWLLVKGGPQRLVEGLVACLLLQGASLIIGGTRPSAPLIGVAAFAVLFAVPIAGGASHALWQRKVPPTIQGGVFAVRVALGYITLPTALLIAGPLAELIFEPLLAPEGALASSAGALLGVGAGRGAALLFILLGAVSLSVALLARRSPALAGLERDIPDYWTLTALVPHSRSALPPALPPSSGGDAPSKRGSASAAPSQGVA
jgi:MFS family permease